MNVVFIFIAFTFGVLSCVVGLAFAANISDADGALSHSLYVERVAGRLNEEPMPEGMEGYPADKVWYVAMKKAVEIVRNGGKD